jgi:hypothetical protein
MPVLDMVAAGAQKSELLAQREYIKNAIIFARAGLIKRCATLI